MNWIALLFTLELGFLPNGYIANFQESPTSWTNLAGQGYIYMESGVELFDFLFIGGDIKTYLDKYNSSKDFMPTNIEYGFFIKAEWKGLSIGFRHYCFHPTIPWIYSRETTPAWEGWYEEVYIRMEAKL